MVVAGTSPLSADAIGEKIVRARSVERALMFIGWIVLVIGVLGMALTVVMWVAGQIDVLGQQIRQALSPGFREPIRNTLRCAIPAAMGLEERRRGRRDLRHALGQPVVGMHGRLDERQQAGGHGIILDDRRLGLVGGFHAEHAQDLGDLRRLLVL